MGVADMLVFVDGLLFPPPPATEDKPLALVGIMPMPLPPAICGLDIMKGMPLFVLEAQATEERG